MNNSEEIRIKCRKCGGTFAPDLRIKGCWPCPTCPEKNPNLKRHYRSVADLCILGLIFGGVWVFVGFNKRGLDLGIVLTAADMILLLVTIIFIYKSRSPWTDVPAKTLIWVVFGFALLSNVGTAATFGRKLSIGVLAIYAVVFSYLFWLNAQASKCTVPKAPRASSGEKT
jgi:hypothetical protein